VHIQYTDYEDITITDIAQLTLDPSVHKRAAGIASQYRLASDNNTRTSGTEAA